MSETASHRRGAAVLCKSSGELGCGQAGCWHVGTAPLAFLSQSCVEMLLQRRFIHTLNQGFGHYSTSCQTLHDCVHTKCLAFLHGSERRMDRVINVTCEREAQLTGDVQIHDRGPLVEKVRPSGQTCKSSLRFMSKIWFRLLDVFYLFDLMEPT